MLQPILVTGPHRSGTTWIGQILATDPSTAYVHEPFSLLCRPGIFRHRVPHWYFHVPAGSEPNGIGAAYADTLRFRYSYGAELRALRTPRDAARMIRDVFRVNAARLGDRRPLIKDPLALFSAEWIARTFGSAILVTSRHPVAFVSSLLRLGWRFDFANLEQQPELMDTLLAEVHEDIECGRRLGANDHLVEAAYLWKILHHVIARYRETKPEWVFVRYKDLAADPLARFQEIFTRLGLTFSDHTRRRIEWLSGDDNPEDRPASAAVTRVASSAYAAKARQRLAESERERVRAIVEPVSSLFYADHEW
ncbi:MAG TPA: sulfotransferase [Thermoanaerobaculia bacterium]|nr:sulfotransferase [Thermoanaerobaculia bacterium]